MKDKIIKLSSIRDESDLKVMFKWINDKEMVSFNSHYKPVDYISHLEWFNTIRKDNTAILFSIRTNEDKFIGTCQLHSISSINRSAELQIRISLCDTSKGYGYEALQQLMKYGFDELNLHKIYLHVFENNTRAIGLYKKMNFQVDGVLRDGIYLNGKYENILAMSILEKEWRGGVAHFDNRVKLTKCLHVEYSESKETLFSQCDLKIA